MTPQQLKTLKSRYYVAKSSKTDWPYGDFQQWLEAVIKATPPSHNPADCRVYYKEDGIEVKPVSGGGKRRRQEARKTVFRPDDERTIIEVAVLVTTVLSEGEPVRMEDLDDLANQILGEIA